MKGFVVRRNLATAAENYLPHSQRLSAKSLCKHFIQPVGIEPNHHLIAYDNRRSSPALVGPDQFKDGLLVHAHILYFKRNPFLRKVGFSP